MSGVLYSYAKSAAAVECLVTGKDRIKERLPEACQGGFVLIDRSTLPDEAKPANDEIRDLAIVRGIENLSEDEAQRAAALMHELAERLRGVVD